MNWTAWNSVRAKALTNRPSDMPSSALATASTTDQRGRAGDLEAERAEGDGARDRRLHGGDAAKAIA